MPGAIATDAQLFGNFSAAKQRRMPRWAPPLLGAMVMGHVIVFAVMWAKSIWEIEALDRPKTKLDLAIAPPPPPPPPPPPGGAKPKTETLQPKKPRVKDLVQPVKVEKQQQVQESADPAGEEGGEEGGVAGGVSGGVGEAPPPPPPPPPPPQVVAPTMLEGSRISGEKMIVPDDVTKTEIQRSGKDRVLGSFKLCIDVSGNVTSVNMMKTTGFPSYDGKIQQKMRKEWRYRPYAVNGKAVPVCTAVTFIYSQK